MRANEFIAEGAFNHKHQNVSAMDKLIVLEAHYAHNGNLRESNTAEVAEYFQMLIDDSMPGVKGQLYIFCYLALVSDNIIPVEPTTSGEIVELTDDSYTIKTDNITLALPINYKWQSSLSHTFCFNNKEDYDQFSTIIKLKFNKDLI